MDSNITERRCLGSHSDSSQSNPTIMSANSRREMPDWDRVGREASRTPRSLRQLMKQMEQLSEYDQTKANRQQGDAAGCPEAHLIPGLIHNQFWVRRFPPEVGLKCCLQRDSYWQRFRKTETGSINSQTWGKTLHELKKWNNLKINYGILFLLINFSLSSK